MDGGLTARLQRSIAAVLMAVLAGLSASGVSAAGPDPLAPGDRRDARVSPLAAATLAVADLDLARRFFGQALAMDCQAHRLTGRSAAVFRRHHGLPGAGPLELMWCARPGIEGAVRLRLIARGPDAPLSRPGHDARYPGGLSLGFPTTDNARLLARAEALGFRASAGLTRITLPRGDGTTYQVGEVHFLAPDGVYALGIDRGAMPPVGPIDPATGVGGPAYSGLMTRDIAAVGRLLEAVLGFEKRREVELESAGPEGGLSLPAGTRFAFQQWFAPGASTGYVILMQLYTQALAPVAPPPPDARGLAMWTFATADLRSTSRAARAAGIPILAGPAWVADGSGGRQRSLVLGTPEGFRIELVEAGTRP